jgi:sigma-B regulation protein RsbU (phosphoserine phosphatase)
MLGIFENIELEERTIQVAPGDLLLFYTDGVTEARDIGNQMFEEERLRDVVAAHPKASAQQLVGAVIEAVEAFSRDTPQADDLTLFVVKRQPA